MECLNSMSSKKPKEIFDTILETKGGVMGLNKPGQLPRNRQQISDKKKHSKQTDDKDELKVLMDKITMEKNKHDNTYIFELSTDPELIVFIAEETQMHDMEVFCTNPGNFCILGVDPTFNVGNYMVTITQYRNLKLKTRREVSPVMLGPVLIHQRKFEHSYFELPCKMLKYNPNLDGLLAFGTDGEHNLQKVFNMFFPNALHLLCDLHMKDNVKSKLSSLQITKAIGSQYIEDIFGRDFDQQRKPGLVDANSPEDFDNKLSNLKDSWTKRHRNGFDFFLYFIEEKAALIKNHMTADIRAMSGLGYPPIQYTQNANESINSAFKRGLEKKLTLTECVNKIQHFIKQQQEQVRLAVISGGGEYEVRPEYEHIKIEEAKFYRMGEKSRRAALGKFFRAEVVPKNKQVCIDHESIPAETPDQHQNLSIPISKCGVTKVPYEIMEDIYNKANDILKKTNHMVHAPGTADDVYLVASLSTPNSPHSVKVLNNNGNMVCDENCIRWKAYKICPHILVVAQKIEGHLKKFLDWHKSLKYPGANMMTLSTVNLPKGRGKKAQKSTSIRKGPMNTKPREPVSYIDQYPSTSHDQCQLPIPAPAVPDPVSGSYMVALLQFCNQNVSKCFGCHGALKDNNIVPTAPRNMVIVSKMKRKYVTHDGIEREGSLSNVYFHFNEHCIKGKDAYFLPSLLYCPDDIKPHLLQSQKDHLRSLGVPL